MPRSLRGRVTLASAGVLAVGLALLTGAVYALLSARLQAEASRALGERTDLQRATLSLRRGRLEIRDGAGDQALDRTAWVFSGGRAVERPTASAQAQRAAAELSTVRYPTERNVGEALRLRAAPVSLEGRRRGTVVVGLSLKPYEQTEHLALLAMLILDAFVLGVGLLVVRRGVGKALQPVAGMTAAAADWSERDLERRFNLGPPMDELTALSATLDALLARIAASVRHEQRFSAEMAHELRTPLAGLRGETELALRRRDLAPHVRESFEAILRSADRTQRVMDTLLAAARRDAGPATGSADAAEVVQAAGEEAQAAALTAGVSVSVHAPDRPARVGVDHDLAVQALNPLLDNAIRHAHSSVRLAAAAELDMVVLRVFDDGDGVSPDQRETIFIAGHSGDGEGAGLGLPLARRLARSGGGDVELGQAGSGGCFELRLPSL
jgi:two-component system OmpR family sensor kinase